MLTSCLTFSYLCAGSPLSSGPAFLIAWVRKTPSKTTRRCRNEHGEVTLIRTDPLKRDPQASSGSEEWYIVSFIVVPSISLEPARYTTRSARLTPIEARRRLNFMMSTKQHHSAKQTSMLVLRLSATEGLPTLTVYVGRLL